MQIFKSKNYRGFLRSWTEKHEAPRGLLSKLAQAMGCHNSHLSRVLREEIHLTPDQAFGATEFMQLSETETNYFLKLVEFERVSNPKFRERLAGELDSMRAAQENLAQKFKGEVAQTQSSSEMTYYSAWFWSAIHILTTIPKFQDAKSIADRLKLDERFVKDCLAQLESFNLVKNTNGRYKITAQNIHLPKTSAMNSVQHMNWRTQAVLKSQNPGNSGLHYTVVQSVSEKDFENIKDLFLQTISQYRKIADKSKEEELVCFSCDFFKV